MRSAQFGRQSNPPTAIIGAANTARDGSGTIITLMTGVGKYAISSMAIATDLITINGWSNVSNDVLTPICNGDVINFVSGTPSTGAALNVDYLISELSINTTTNVATFRILNAATFAPIDLTGADASNVVIMFDNPTRIDGIQFKSAQATMAATATKVFCAFIQKRGTAVWDLIGDVLMTGTTPSTIVVTPQATILFSNGLIVGAGDKIGVTQSVYATAADRTSVFAFNHAKM